MPDHPVPTCVVGVRRACVGGAAPIDVEHMDIWAWVAANLHIILPVGIPTGFFLLDLLLKSVLGQPKFDSVGGDMAKTGAIVFISAILTQIYYQRMTGPADIPTAAILSMVAAAVWVLCLSLSLKKFPLGKGNAAQPYASAVLGAFALGACCVITMQIWGLAK